MNDFTALCQSEKQVRWLVSSTTYRGKIAHWIAATPSACWGLRHENLPFSTLEAGQQNKTPDYIESLQREQVRWAEKVDAFLQETIPAFNERAFFPARNYLYYLKSPWDTVIHLADLLESADRAGVPGQILFFGNPAQCSYSPDLTPSFSLLSDCIPAWADHHGIPVTPLPPLPGDLLWQNQDQMRMGIRRTITAILPRSLVQRIQSLQNHPVFLDPATCIRRPPKKGEVLIRNSYDLTTEVSRYLIRNGLVPRSFDDAVAESKSEGTPDLSLNPLLKEAWDQIVDSVLFWKPGGWQTWSTRACLEPLFRHFWFGIVPELWQSYMDSLAFFDKRQPRAICVPSIWEPRETGFIMAARAARVPVIFFQHGACVGDIENSVWDLTDALYSDHILVYGAGPENYIRSRSVYSNSSAQPHAVGSPRLDRIVQGISDARRDALRKALGNTPGTPLVVYVPGVIGTYFRYDYQDFRYCRTFDLRCLVADLFAGHPDVQFAYKAFISQGHDPTVEMLKERCPSCSVVTTIPLTDVQWAADLIIHEIPGTGMYEGLMTDRPMIVLVDREIYRMPLDVKRMLGKRVGLAESSSDLILQVRQFLDEGKFSSLVSPDREFVKNYCTHLDDGQSSRRAAEAIISLVEKPAFTGDSGS